MIICFNYSQDGNRYIANMEWNIGRDEKSVSNRAQLLKELYDEVYIIAFTPNQELMNEVLLKGCRI